MWIDETEKKSYHSDMCTHFPLFVDLSPKSKSILQVPPNITACLFFSFLLHAIPINGWSQGGANNEAPTVLMAEIDGITPSSTELLTAIRAQLSASQINIQHATVPNFDDGKESYLDTAVELSSRYNAQIVFWVHDAPQEIVIYFYNSVDTPHDLYRRALILESENRSSRFEVVANAVSSLLEGSILPRRNESSPQSYPVPQQSTQNSEVAEVPTHLPELFIAYTGSLFSKDTLASGIQIGIVVLPAAWLAFNLSFTQNLTIEWNTDDYNFSMKSRRFSGAISGRIGTQRPIELRPGISWRTSIRTYAIESKVETLHIKPTKSNAIHSIMPFVSMHWRVQHSVVVIVAIGASIALNETVYEVTRLPNRRETATRPLTVKPVLQLGLAIQL